MLTSGAHVLVLAVGSDCKVRPPRPSSFIDNSIDEQQRGDLPASTRSRWRQDALQPPLILGGFPGLETGGPFPDGGLQCITWNSRDLIGSVSSKQKNREFKLIYLKKLFDDNNILCLQEVRGKDEYLKAIQESAPRSRFFGTFILGKESAGGSAKCIHRDLLPEDAIVTHDYLPRP